METEKKVKYIHQLRTCDDDGIVDVGFAEEGVELLGNDEDGLEEVGFDEVGAEEDGDDVVGTEVLGLDEGLDDLYSHLKRIMSII